MAATPAPAAVHAEEIQIDPDRPLLIVDVDEVLAYFMRGFERFLAPHGYEMRITRFALFQNIYPRGGAEPIDMAVGKPLFDAFFETAVDALEPVEGAAESLARLSQAAQIVVLTNAPAAARAGRARWLAEHDMAYPLTVNEGLKGRECARLAAGTNRATVFVDDLLPNLRSTHEAAPQITLFQSVADSRLRPYAPGDPAICARHDDWRDLEPALARALAA